jgi:predicted Zn-dependent protease
MFRSDRLRDVSVREPWREHGLRRAWGARSPSKHGILLGVLVFSFWGGAASAQTSFSAAPGPAQTTKEKGLGNVVDAEMLQGNLVLMNSPFQDELQQLVNELGQQTNRPDLTFTVRILCNDSINAYATSGGYIYIHSGLLDFLTDRDQLAAILAHEIHHAATSAVLQDLSGRTGMKSSIEKEAIMLGWMSLGAFAGAAIGVKTGAIPKMQPAVAAQPAGRPPVGRVDGVLVVTGPGSPARPGVPAQVQMPAPITQLGGDLGRSQGMLAAASAMTRFSAKVELDADKAAVDYLANTGHNPTVLLDVMNKFKALKTDKKDELSKYRVGWIDKKPGLDERIRNIRQILDARPMSESQPHAPLP